MKLLSPLPAGNKSLELPSQKFFLKYTTLIIKGSFLYILNQNEIFFQKDKVWECTSCANDWEGGGEAAVINLGHASLPLPAVTLPLWEPRPAQG